MGRQVIYDYRAIETYETVNLYSLATLVDGHPEPVQHLDGAPMFMGDLVFYPVEFSLSGRRDSVRADLLQPISGMEALAWAAK
jgi:hypothetical protein